MKVQLRNLRDGDIAHIKIGWSWPAFLLGFTGIPLFLKGLYGWGSTLAALTLIKPMLRDVVVSLPGNIVLYRPAVMADLMLVCTLFLVGYKANAWQARKYLRTGWEFCDPTSTEVAVARQKWRIAT